MKKSYCEIDPNSYDAFYEIDHGDPKGLVEVKDKAINFTWYRSKSNENLTDTREGKGFSFYLARFAYYDKYKIIDNDLAKDKNNTGILSMIEFDKKVMIVINVKLDENEKIHIVSAYYTSDPKLIKEYNVNKAIMKRIEEAISLRTDEELQRLKENIERRQRYIDELEKKV